MQNETKITCPHCKNTFELTEIYKKEIEANILKDFDKKLAEATKQAIEKEKKITAQQNDVYKRKIDELFAKNQELEQKTKTNQELEIQIAELQNANKQIQSNRELEIQKAIINQKNESQKEKENEINDWKRLYSEQQKNSEIQLRNELEEKIKLQKQNELERINLQKQCELSKLKEELELKYELKLKEKDETLFQTQKRLEEANKTITQNSMQVQGEAQEKLLSERLKEIFIYDVFAAKTIGKEESDIEQTIIDNGKYCGKIIYESKNTKAFNSDWIPKLKKDGQNANADSLVLITQTMPTNNDKLHQIDNVWICPIHNFEVVAKTLRFGLIEINKQKITNENKHDKMVQLYNFMNSKEFQNYMDLIFIGIKRLKDTYEKERTYMLKVWEQRKKEFENIYDNTAMFIGAIKGISTIDMEQFELPAQQHLLD